MFPENTGRTEVLLAVRRTPRGKHSSQGGKIGIRRAAGRRETNMVGTPRAVTNDSIDGPGVVEGRLSTRRETDAVTVGTSSCPYQLRVSFFISYYQSP